MLTDLVKTTNTIPLSFYLNRPMSQLAYNNNMMEYTSLEKRSCIPLQSKCFNNFYLDILNVIAYTITMRDASFFLHPRHDWQRRYEAIRATLVARLPAKVVADKF